MLGTRAWFVISIYAGRDYKARDELIERAGFAKDDVWLPECNIRRRVRTTILNHKGPLFPGYVFLRTDPSCTDWRSVESVRWVDGPLRHQGTPWPLREDDVGRLRALVGDRHLLIDLDGRATREFAVDDPVEITSGPFAGWNGIVSEKIGDRLKILLDIFGRSTQTLVPEALVISVDAAE